MNPFLNNLFKIKNITADPYDENIDEDTNNYRIVGQLKFVIVALIVLAAWLAVALSRSNDNKIVNVSIPGTIYAQPLIKVGNGWANDFYFKVWSDWMINESATFTPSTAKDKLNLVLKMIQPEKTAQYVGPLANLNNMILRNMVSQRFTIKGMAAKYYSDKNFENETSNALETIGAVYTYSGTATQSFGNSMPIDKQCTYTVSLILDGGHLYAPTYDTTCFKK